ncbi:GDSL-type esterase/lipase family protein [Marivirga sp.]|uniref:fibronectin type III domain-containing protein n=1 Tax=Marivirga sp. TaxID=2018662 RepID=UPI0025D46FB3|nr:GDSL-type esterase/lipase family protein [Marivirga sp.]
MNKILTLLSIILIFSINITSAQIVDNYLYGYKFHEKPDNATGPKLDIDRYPILDGTYSFREDTAGGVTSYYDRTNWDSDQYEQGHIIDDGSQLPEFKLNFRLLKPNGYDENYEDGYPLIIMLHGAGERGNCWSNNCYYASPSWDPLVNEPQAGPKYFTVELVSGNAVFTSSLVHEFTAGMEVEINSSTIGNYKGIYKVSSTNLTDQSFQLNDFTFEANASGKIIKRDFNNLFNNDHNLLHGGRQHLDAVNSAGTKLPNDPTLGTGDFPGFVLFPQNSNGWGGSEIKNVVRVIHNVLDQYNINRNRVVVHGLSNGAQHVVTLLKTDPALFAGVLLMSPSSANTKVQDSEEMAHIPMWVFQGGKDSNPTVSQTNSLVRWFEEMGGSVRYTLYENLGHGTWNTAYKEPDFFSWIKEKDNSDIFVYYGDSTICTSNGQGAKLGVPRGFRKYEWERDGQIITGLDSATAYADIAGTYRARFSRFHENPTADQWNNWSEPIVIKESIVKTPKITALNTTHLPDINGVDSVQIQTNEASNLYYYWNKDGVDLSDTTFYHNAKLAGTYKVSTETFGGCPSNISKNIYVTFNAPADLLIPANVQANLTSSGSVRLFWDDENSLENGYEVYRSTAVDGFYDFLGLLDEDAISFEDVTAFSGIEYFYKLRAVSNDKVSPYTSAVSIVTGTDNEKPSTPGNLIVENYTITSSTLCWEASSDNEAVKQYFIYYGADSVATNSDATCFTIENLAKGRNFTFTVKAVDYSGNISMASNQVNVTTIFEGLTYEHSTGSYDSLDEIDWNFIEYKGVVPNFSISERTQEDYFSFKFDGYIYIEQAGEYEFRTKSGDGSRLYIGGFDTTNLVFDNDGLHGCNFGNNAPAILNLSVGAYPITVTYFEKSGGQCLEVYYKSPGGNWALIPDEMLKSGTIENNNPPAVPTNLTASADGMDQINLSWAQTDIIPDDLDIVVLGSSTAEGYGVVADSAWVGRLDHWLGENSTNYTLTNLALGGYNTYHIRPTGSDNSASSNDTPDTERNITKALSLNPDIIIVNMPSNNVQQGYSVDTTMFHYRELKALADNAGVKTLFTTTQPRNFGPDRRDTLAIEADSVRANFGNYVIDIYDSLAAVDLTIKPVFDSGDGIHPNELGHGYIFSEVQIKLMQFLTHFEIYRSLESGGNYQMIGRIENGFTYHEDVDLLPGHSYYYKIKAVNLNGSSAFTNTVNATTVEDTDPPSVPSNLEVVSTTYTNFGIMWTASTDNHEVDKYLVYANDVWIGESNNNTFYTSDLEPESTYIIKVEAVDVSGNTSSPSAGISVTSDATINFYAKSTGDLNELSTWGLSTDGSGTAPENFFKNGQVFNLRNRSTNSVLTSQWQIDGSISKLVVEPGETLDISAVLDGNIQLMGDAVVHVNSTNLPKFLPSAANSHVYFNTYDHLPVGKFGNITLNSFGQKDLGEGTLEILGDLEISGQLGLKGLPSNLSKILLYGDLKIQDEPVTIALDNLASLEFAGDKSHNIELIGNLQFYDIAISAQDTVIIQALNPIEVSLGSGNGGGLVLNDSSRFDIGAHALKIVGAGKFNADNSNASIASNFGRISINSSSNSTSNLQLDTIMNKLSRLEFGTTGAMQLHNKLELFDRIDLDGGTFQSNGHLVLKSNDTTTAQVLPMKNGAQLLGEVKVERYIAPARLYRYISSPVSGITVEDWQEFFPITGNFNGASTGTGLSSNPSLFYYDDENGGWKEYPISGTDNTSPINIGTGYAAFMREETNPVIIENFGNLHQGNFTYSLSIGTGHEDDGWSLIGNPYAATIQWENEGWISSGISNIVSVAKNTTNGKSQFFVYDRSDGTGDLVNGEIASGQSVWVQAMNSTPSLTITEEAISINENASGAEFMRTLPNKDHHLKIVLRDPSNQEDATYVKFRESASDEYVKMEDGFKRPNSIINFYSQSTDNVNLAMNTMSMEFCELNIPLQINNASSGDFKLNFENIERFPLALVSLIDVYKKDTIALNQNQILNISVDENEINSYQDRFILNLVRPEVDLNLNLVYDDKYCSGNSSVDVEIENSQYGVQYYIANENGMQITDPITGTGESILVSIDSSYMISNSEQFHVKSLFPGCTVYDNDEMFQVQKLEVGAPDLQKDFIIDCEGSSLILIANRQNDTDEILWFNEPYNESIENSGDTLFFHDIGNNFELISAQSRSAEGCLSEKTMLELSRGDFENNFIVENQEIQWGDEAEFCVGTESFTVNIPNSTEGIYYSAFYDGNQISSQTMGTGEKIEIIIDINSLNNGLNELKIVASISGCEEIELNSTHTIELIDTPQIELTDEEYRGCEGEEINLTLINENENTVYEWFASGDLIEGETLSNLSIENLTADLLPISVRASNQLGCSNGDLIEVPIVIVETMPIVFEQENYSVCTGGELTVALEGNYENHTIKWYSAGGLLVNETEASLTLNDFNMEMLPVEVVVENDLGCSDNGLLEIPVQFNSIEIPILQVEGDSLFIQNVSAEVNIYWYFNDELQAEYNDLSSILLLESGSYTVILEDSNCSVISEAFEYLISFNVGKLDNQSVLVYPNPTNKYYLNIQSGALKGKDIGLQLMDLNGRIILSETVNKTDIESGYKLELPKGLDNGIYQLRMLNEEEMGVFKIVFNQ